MGLFFIPKNATILTRYYLTALRQTSMNKTSLSNNSLKAGLICSLLISAILITGCQENSKWNHQDPGLPASFYQTQQQLLDNAQAKLKQNPQDFTSQFEVAFRYQNLGNLRAAVAEYQKALAIPGNEKDFATLNNLAASYKNAEDYANAAKYVKMLYETNSDNDRVIGTTVEILLLNNEPDAAQAALTNFTKVLKEKKTGSDSDQAMISQLFQSIVDYRNKHAQK